MPRPCLLAAGAIALCGDAVPRAFHDREVCVAARQLALAAENDVGLWIDRATRNTGMAMFCDRKLVEFKTSPTLISIAGSYLTIKG
jgi:hypothetical protein